MLKLDLILQIMNQNAISLIDYYKNEKNKKVIGLMKDELGGQIMTKFVRLRAKTYSYVIDDDSKDKKAKGTKKCVKKRKLKFESYKNCLEATQLDNKTKYLEKNKISIDSLKKSLKIHKKL